MSNPRTQPTRPDPVPGGEDGILVDAATVAPHLGLTPERFMTELRRGLVYQVAEKGEGADRGRYRLTFRYRSREYRVVVDGKGRILEDSAGADR